MSYIFYFTCRATPNVFAYFLFLEFFFFLNNFLFATVTAGKEIYSSTIRYHTLMCCMFFLEL